MANPKRLSKLYSLMQSIEVRIHRLPVLMRASCLGVSLAADMVFNRSRSFLSLTLAPCHVMACRASWVAARE